MIAPFPSRSPAIHVPARAASELDGRLASGHRILQRLAEIDVAGLIAGRIGIGDIRRQQEKARTRDGDLPIHASPLSATDPTGRQSSESVAASPSALRERFRGLSHQRVVP
jgi:hypothetical protein